MSWIPNYKARVNRANRNKVPTNSVLDSFRKTKVLAIFLIVIFPIYPSLAAIGNTSETTVGDYDESSILASFNDTEGLGYVSETGMVTGDISNSWAQDAKEETNTSAETVPESNVRTYTVVEYDDVIKIWKKYHIDPEVILWTNNLSMNDTLSVGQVLKIPAVSGVVHVLKPGETISDLAKEYNISTREILDYNNISDATKIPDGKKLMIPGAVKKVVEVAKPVQVAVVKTTAKTTEKPVAKTNTTRASVSTEESTPVLASSANTSDARRYQIKYTGNGRGFAAGNCTWHVARYKNVTWRGNANQWIRNARAQGVPTGKTPAIGAIVQFSGHGYNSYYGHVGYVTDITDTHIIVSDMNYRQLYEVTVRKIAKNDPAIDGYIYVD